jgi:hypothetical protein
MVKFKLEMDDFYNEDFHLLAIHSTLVDYQMAFLLNKNLHLNLNRLPNDITHKTQSYASFEWVNTNNDSAWVLASNSSKNTTTASRITDLFANQSETFITKNYLIKELKKVDYFLKISNSEETQLNRVSYKQFKIYPKLSQVIA